MSEHQPLQGARILIAEDEPLLAFEMMNVLLKAGAKVIGPAMSVERTLELVLAEKLTADSGYSCSLLRRGFGAP